MICNDSPNQKALAWKINQQVKLDVLAVRSSPRRQDSQISKVLRRGLPGVFETIVSYPYRRAWFNMLGKYQLSYPWFPIDPSFEFSDVNEECVYELVATEKPSLVIVSGTNLLKAPLIEKILESGKVVNLHTGISPYIKGGPNCTNWCLSLGEFRLIGNSVMWLGAGIDSGNLIATERTVLNGHESLATLHFKVMEHAHDLYLRCIYLLVHNRNVPSVRQSDFPIQRLFLTREWNTMAKVSGLFNFYLHFKLRRKHQTSKNAVRLVSPDWNQR